MYEKKKLGSEASTGVSDSRALRLIFAARIDVPRLNNLSGDERQGAERLPGYAYQRLLEVEELGR